MAHENDLAQRTRAALKEMQAPQLTEKKMFGGVGFMVRGNMACGVHKHRLIVRVGIEAHQKALAMPFAGEFDITGRSMKGWVMVEEQGCNDEALKQWVKSGLEYALTLPAKP